MPHGIVGPAEDVKLYVKPLPLYVWNSDRLVSAHFACRLDPGRSMINSSRTTIPMRKLMEAKKMPAAD